MSDKRQKNQLKLAFTEEERSVDPESPYVTPDQRGRCIEPSR